MQPGDASGDLDPTVTKWEKLLSRGFVPGSGTAFREHTHLIMQETTDRAQVLLNGKTCATGTGKDFVIMSQH